jgi:hypothetical protein
MVVMSFFVVTEDTMANQQVMYQYYPYGPIRRYARLSNKDKSKDNNNVLESCLTKDDLDTNIVMR